MNLLEQLNNLLEVKRSKMEREFRKFYRKIKNHHNPKVAEYASTMVYSFHADWLEDKKEESYLDDEGLKEVIQAVYDDLGTSYTDAARTLEDMFKKRYPWLKDNFED